MPPQTLGFNPLPSPKQGETCRGSIGRSWPYCFNPLPSPKQGETPPSAAHGRRAPVSIRSPHRSKGRPAGAGRLNLHAHRFNPLPSPKQGKTGIASPWPSAITVSIRSPHRSKGRPDPFRVAPRRIFVSIRSPHRSKGRRPRLWLGSTGGLFQSAPLTEARGDLPIVVAYDGVDVFQSAPLTEARGDGGPFVYLADILPVSIRSPHRSKGRHRSIVIGSSQLMFQSAPLTEARGDQIEIEIFPLPWSFNPLPSPKQGETRQV